MQIALVLSDRIRMFSEYSLDISNFVLHFFPMVGPASSRSSYKPLVSLTSLSFIIIKLSVWISPTLTPRTKIIRTSMVLGSSYPVVFLVAGQWLSNQIVDFLSSHFSLLIRRLAGCFAPPFRQSQGYASIPVPSGLYFPFFLSRFVPGLLLFPVRISLLTRNARCRR